MRTVFAVGMRRPIPPVVEGIDVKSLTLRRFREVLLPRRQGTFVILGPDALLRLSPALVRKAIWRPYAMEISVAGPGVTFDVIKRWAAAGIAVLHEGASLKGPIARFARIPARVAVEEGWWVPEEARRDPFLARAVLLVPGLWKHDVEHWAAELEIDRRELCGRCRAACGLTAKQICKRYVFTYAWSERARRVPWGHLAAALNYADPSDLRAAVGASRWRVGRRFARLDAEILAAHSRARLTTMGGSDSPAVPSESPSVPTDSPLRV